MAKKTKKHTAPTMTVKEIQIGAARQIQHMKSWELPKPYCTAVSAFEKKYPEFGDNPWGCEYSTEAFNAFKTLVEVYIPTTYKKLHGTYC